MLETQVQNKRENKIEGMIKSTKKMLLKRHCQLEYELDKANNLEEKTKISYKIGENLAAIILLGKNLIIIDETEITNKQIQVKNIKQNIKIANKNNDINNLLELHLELGMNQKWIKIVKLAFQQI